MSSWGDRIDDILSKKSIPSNYHKKELIARVSNFINNETTCWGKKELLKIIEKTDLYFNQEINDFIFRELEKIPENYYIFDFKNNNKSSSTQLISYAIREGYLSEDYLLNLDKIKKDKIKSVKRIVLIDDFIGTGNTIMKAIIELNKIIRFEEIIIICYICYENGKNVLEEYGYKPIYYTTTCDFKKKYAEDKTEYIEKMCNYYMENKKHDLYKFGYLNSGTMIAINDIAPNTDLPLLWSDSFREIKWIPLFSRKENFKFLNQKNKKLIKNNSTYLKTLFKNDNRFNLEYNEFEFLLYSFSCFYTLSEIVENGFFSTIEEANIFLNKMEANKYGGIHNGYFIITDKKMYYYLGSIIKRIDNFENKYLKNPNVKFEGDS